MLRIGFFLFIALVITSTGLEAQTYRTYTGWGNNIQNPLWGARHDTLVDRTRPSFSDGYASPAGQNRQNPRRISNYLTEQPGVLFSQDGFSDLVWLFGQFIDHEFALVDNNPQEPFPIFVNFPDPFFNPGGVLPAVTMDLRRSKHIPGTGTEPGNPRRFPAEISAFFDASLVYGSDSTWAAWLRTFKDGKLKTSSGNLLPFNTVNGELEGELDPTAPFMDNPFPFVTKLFVAGDIRVNENIFLTAMHLLWVREHNYQCDQIKRQHPDWNDEQIYQHARKIIGGEISAIAYEEWLPLLGVKIPPYSGYDPTVHPGMNNLFSAAAFRLGHTLLSSNLPRRDNLGKPIPQGDVLLKNAFFNPTEFLNSGGPESIFKGASVQMQQDMDHKAIHDVRNFLFGTPGAGGRDLIAINIQRGRERGLADFNTIREDYGLPLYNSFSELFPDNAQLAAYFEVAFGNINNIDPWVGLMAEPRMEGSVFGPTLNAVLVDQFTHFRDGDRFFYLNDPDLSTEEKDRITATRLYDIMMRNLDITVLQKNVFLATPQNELCAATTYEADIQASIISDGTSLPMSQVDVTLAPQYKDASLQVSNASGTCSFQNQQTCRHYDIFATKADSYKNGLSIADVIYLNKHLVGTQTLPSPYKLLAADVNGSGDLSVADMQWMRRIIIGTATEFPAVPTWRFLNDDYAFANAQTPFQELDAASKAEIHKLEQTTSFQLRGIKMGDLNGSAKTGLLQSEVRTRNPLILQIKSQQLKKGDTYDLHLTSENIQDFMGIQLAIQYPSGSATLEEIIPLNNISLTPNVDYVHHQKEGKLNLATFWEEQTIEGAFPVVLRFTIHEKINSRDLIQLTSQDMQRLAVTWDIDETDVVLQAIDEIGTSEEVAPFIVYGNQPNPFTGETIISFEAPQSGDVMLTIFDLNGRLLLQRTQYFYKGYNQTTLSSQDIPGSNGILIYQLSSANGSFVDRMILSK